MPPSRLHEARNSCEAGGWEPNKVMISSLSMPGDVGSLNVFQARSTALFNPRSPDRSASKNLRRLVYSADLRPRPESGGLPSDALVGLLSMSFQMLRARKRNLRSVRVRSAWS